MNAGLSRQVAADVVVARSVVANRHRAPVKHLETVVRSPSRTTFECGMAREGARTKAGPSVDYRARELG